MAYADIGDIASGAVISETYLDQIRANFQAGVPDIFTTKGDLAAGSGTDAAVRVGVGADDSTLVADSSQAGGIAWQIQPSARVYNSADINPTAATWVSLTFDSERWDTDAMHSTASNTGRLTIPTGGDGEYSIGGNAEFATGIEANASSRVGLRIILNGTTVIAQKFDSTYRAETYNNVVALSTSYRLAAADFIELQAYTSQDVNVVAAGNYSPEFWASWQRRA